MMACYGCPVGGGCVDRDRLDANGDTNGNADGGAPD
jgi:hypothetical protein